MKERPMETCFDASIFDKWSECKSTKTKKWVIEFRRVK